jgi:hypothetical protein
MTNDGGLVVALEWGDSSVDLDLYLTAASCNAYPPTSCTILARSEGNNTATERLTQAVRRGESFRAWVDNFDRTRSQSYTLQTALVATGSSAARAPSMVTIDAVRSAPVTARRHSRRRDAHVRFRR